MKLRSALAAVALAAISLTPAAARAQASDIICPRATPKIDAFNDAAKAADPVKIAGAAQGVADAYLACFNDAKFTPAVEPKANYDEIRVAQYLVLVGRAKAAGGKTAEAGQAYKEAVKYATEVVEWLPSTQTVHQSSGAAGNSAERNMDRRPSRYHDDAVEIRATALAEMAKLTASSPAPAAAASPKP